MATHDDQEHFEEERVKQLIDRLAEILKGLPPDRQQAFREYLREQTESEADDGGATQAVDP
jgi:hypothetical protein